MGLTYSEVISRHATGCRLIAIAGGTRAAGIASDYGVAHVPTTVALLERPDVDAVVLATPDQDRVELTRMAAAAGKHVLAEKPMAPTVAECDAMIEACEAAKVNLGVVKTERFRKITRRAKELIDEGVLGPIRMMRTVSAFPLSLTVNYAMTESGCWTRAAVDCSWAWQLINADFLRWLTGRNATQVFAQATTYSDLPSTNLSVMAQITFEDGLMAQMWITSEIARAKYSEQRSALSSGWSRCHDRLGEL